MKITSHHQILSISLPFMRYGALRHFLSACGLLMLPALLSLLDIAATHMPLQEAGCAFIIAGLAGIVLLLFRLFIMVPSDRAALIQAIILISIMLGVYTTAIAALHILMIRLSPGLRHYLSLTVSFLALAAAGRRIVRLSMRRLLPVRNPHASIAPPAAITPYTSGKLEQAVAYLNENYKSDISREGLAGSLGLSVDHLSRKFKAFMGKRIGDYINELRIRDAAACLRATDDKIIDIAFDNGFESLATFNRVFLKITGETPTEFRKRRAPLVPEPAQQPFQELD